VSRDEDAERGEVKAPVPLVVSRVTKENTTCRVGRQLVRSSGSDVRVTGTTENTEVIIARRGTKESLVRRGSWGGIRRKAINQVGGGIETLNPKAWRHRSLDQEGAHDIVRGPNHALSLSVLGRGIWTRHAELDTLREEKRMGSVVIELMLVVTLDSLDGDISDLTRKGKVQE
jgi:hypothetical protein